MKKTSSLVWRFFDRLEENNRCVSVLCKLCDTQYKYFGNTTNLRTHLVNKHPIQWDLLQNGSLDESTFRAAFEEDKPNKRTKYVKNYKEENVDVLENSETDNEAHTDVADAESINIVRQMHSRASDEEWLNDDVYETVETYKPKHKRMKYRTVKREVQSPSPKPRYMPRSIPYKNTERVLVESARKDEYSVFGEYVGNKLRKLQNIQARGNVQQLMATILWQAEYGLYDNMETVKRVLLHSVQEMEVVPATVTVEHLVVNEPETTPAKED